MGSAFFWGAVSGFAVLLGAIVSMVVKIPRKVLGFIMAFGVGILIGAATFELLQDAMEKSHIINTVIGFIAGALTFTILEAVIAHHGGKHRKRSNQHELVKEETSQNDSGLGIFIGTVMDAIPESMMLGMSLIGGKGVSLLLLIAIFISNIPEGLSSTTGMLKSGQSKGKIIFLFAVVTIVAGLSALFGYVFLDNASLGVISMISSFAAGGIITMIGSTMMPEAYEEGGGLVGLMTAFGVITSILLDQLG